MSALPFYILALCTCEVDELPLPPDEGSTEDEFLIFEDASEGGSIEQGAGGHTVAVVDSSTAVIVKMRISVSSAEFQRLAERWRDFLDPEKPFEPIPFFCITPDGTKYVETNGVPRRRALPGAGRKPGMVDFELLLPKPQISYGEAV